MQLSIVILIFLSFRYIAYIVKPYAVLFFEPGLRHCDTSCLEHPIYLAASASELNSISTASYAGRLMPIFLFLMSEFLIDSDILLLCYFELCFVPFLFSSFICSAL